MRAMTTHLIDGQMLNMSPWRFALQPTDMSQQYSTCERQTQNSDFLLNSPRIWKIKQKN